MESPTSMTVWRVTYPDGSFEDVPGLVLRAWDGKLTIVQEDGSRIWPLTAVRSWKQLA